MIRISAYSKTAYIFIASLGLDMSNDAAVFLLSLVCCQELGTLLNPIHSNLHREMLELRLADMHSNESASWVALVQRADA